MSRAFCPLRCLKKDSAPIRFDRLIGQPEIIHGNCLIVEQVLPRAVRRKGNIDRLGLRREIQHDDEALQASIGGIALAVKDHHLFSDIDAVTIRIELCLPRFPIVRIDVV